MKHLPIRSFKNLLHLVILLVVTGLTSEGLAQRVHSQLSSREAFVGSPITYLLAIENAEDYERPLLPEIDGCEVKSAGEPQTSSQITVYNGQMRQTRSVVFRILITPSRAGQFEIPPIDLVVNGKKMATNAETFSATRSETGDLLFVEIESNRKRVYVGQELELTLKIWMKPFSDSKNKITLNEGHMWQMVSEHSKWGHFTERMRELAAQNLRPEGTEVVRKDADGVEQSYYLYEIATKSAPKRPGKIESDQVQIVVDYPLRLEKQRDPLEGFFQDSPLSQMMDDEFFGSPFRNQLTISATRPLIAQALADETDVLPIPSEGRPAGYRGAVGDFQIVTQASPKRVQAGDPITLTIGLAGSGPMDLVQAPPLLELPELTADFQVADDSLAGLVEQDTKTFSTTIRPRSAGVDKVPSIPFSFFDPEQEKFVTVYSDPISITVTESETLTLDQVVHQQPESKSTTDIRTEQRPSVSLPVGLLADSKSIDWIQWWVWCGLGPAAAGMSWLVLGWAGRLGVFRWFALASRSTWRIRRQIEREDRPATLRRLMIQLVGSHFQSTPANVDRAAGLIRNEGKYLLAAELETLIQELERAEQQMDVSDSAVVEGVVASELKSRVNLFADAWITQMGRRFRRVARQIAFLGFSLGIGWGVFSSHAVGWGHQVPDTSNQLKELSVDQQQEILLEAQAALDQALQLADSNSPEFRGLQKTAAHRLQLLVDSGIKNDVLMLELAKAYAGSDQHAIALAYFERARRLNPLAVEARRGIRRESLVLGVSVDSRLPLVNQGFVNQGLAWARTASEYSLDWLGGKAMLGILALGSIVFWMALIFRSFLSKGLFIAVLVVGGFLWLVSGTMLGTLLLTETGTGNAILIKDSTRLLSQPASNREGTEGQELKLGTRLTIVEVIDESVRVQVSNGEEGWLPKSAVCSLENSL